jgi:hypothetical protein
MHKAATARPGSRPQGAILPSFRYLVNVKTIQLTSEAVLAEIVCSSMDAKNGLNGS